MLSYAEVISEFYHSRDKEAVQKLQEIGRVLDSILFEPVTITFDGLYWHFSRETIKYPTAKEVLRQWKKERK